MALSGQLDEHGWAVGITNPSPSPNPHPNLNPDPNLTLTLTLTLTRWAVGISKVLLKAPQQQQP